MNLETQSLALSKNSNKPPSASDVADFKLKHLAQDAPVKILYFVVAFYLALQCETLDWLIKESAQEDARSPRWIEPYWSPKIIEYKSQRSAIDTRRELAVVKRIGEKIREIIYLSRLTNDSVARAN